ncbi:MAG: hypothetical protein RMA76_15740 [Deltaproteobacteria bacterium]|jgi:hypothetical protein
MRRLRAFGILVLVATASFASPASLAFGAEVGAEVDRVRLHLRAAQDFLAERDLSALRPQQRIRRAERLADLDAYIRRGRFPKNEHIPVVRAPYFVDAAGTHCAMAFLIARSGRADLVERVRSTANNAYVYELADDPELAAWLDENGLTIDEAATIQPTYGPICEPRSTCVCQRDSGNVVMEAPDTAHYVRVEEPGAEAVLTVLASVGTATLTVGERVTLPVGVLSQAKVGEHHLVARYADDPLASSFYFRSFGLVEERELVVCQWESSLDLRLDVGVALEAVIADDCHGAVVAASSDFEGDFGPDCGCACSDVAPRTGGASALVLLALLGCAAATRAAGRGRARRRPSSRRSGRYARGTLRPDRSACRGHS